MTSPEAAAALSDVMAEALGAARVVIDGVTYVPIDMDAVSFGNSIYLETVIVEAGLEEPARFMTRDAKATTNAKQLLLALYRSGRTFDFLAGMFVPEGAEWTEATAKVTALRFAATKDPAVKKILQDVIAVSLMGFFTAGLNALGTSPNASARTTAPSEPGPSVGATDSGATGASSDGSRATTPRASRLSSHGRSGKG